MSFANTLELIEEIEQGNQIILLDDESRENEGDLVMAAQDVTSDDINFMAKYGRGLVCLALSKQYVEVLDLPLMAGRNGSRYETNFTISIEAAQGVTTGISAADRAHTIQTAIKDGFEADDIVSPGHVFPLLAREGGVLMRTGHTEASVDFARLSNKKPAAVICEIMNDDGTMARRDDLIIFAKKHGLKIGTIAGLVEHRIRHDNLISLKNSSVIKTDYAGEFECRIYENTLDGSEHIALIKGDVTLEETITVRMHAMNIFEDILATNPDRHGSVEAALKAIDQNGVGVCILLRDARPNALSEAMDLLGKSNHKKGEFRSYGVGAQILFKIGVKNMTLLSNSVAGILPALDGYGLCVIDRQNF